MLYEVAIRSIIIIVDVDVIPFHFRYHIYRRLILMSKSIVVLMQPAKLYPHIFQAL